MCICVLLVHNCEYVFLCVGLYLYTFILFLNKSMLTYAEFFFVFVLCLCICMCLCLFEYIQVHLCLSLHVRIYHDAHVCVCTYMWACVCACIFVHFYVSLSILILRFLLVLYYHISCHVYAYVHLGICAGAHVCGGILTYEGSCMCVYSQKSPELLCSGAIHLNFWLQGLSLAQNPPSM